MRKLTFLLSLTLATAFVTPTITSAAQCNFWQWMWGNCGKKSYDFPCYAEIIQRVAISDPNGNIHFEYHKVSVVTGNRIDCKVGSEDDACSSEGSC